jgi:hypothetical protein
MAARAADGRRLPGGPGSRGWLILAFIAPAPLMTLDATMMNIALQAA